MQFPSESYLEQLRKKVPCRNEITADFYANEKYPILPGTVGEVTHIDDVGSIHMRWENGSSLALIPEIDSFQTVSEAKNKAAPPPLYSMLPYNRKNCKGVFYTIF